MLEYYFKAYNRALDWYINHCISSILRYVESFAKLSWVQEMSSSIFIGFASKSFKIASSSGSRSMAWFFSWLLMLLCLKWDFRNESIL